MKINMPITNTEISFDDKQFMLTKTDLKGTITYANKDFVDISGFTEAELVGANHNVVRHPDMPVEAFEDLWRDVKAGKPWTGLVKNRTKKGDYYWVEANVAPIFEGGNVAGYLSARKKPTRQQVEEANAAYRLFKNGQASGLMIMHGKVIKNSLFGKLQRKLQNTKVGQRLGAIILVSALALFTQGVVSLYKIKQSNATIEYVENSLMHPTRDLGQIAVLVIESRTYLRTALSEATASSDTDKTKLVMSPAEANKAAEGIERNIGKIDGLLKAYATKDNLEPKEKALIANFTKSYDDFVRQVLRPEVGALRAANHEDAKRYAEISNDLYGAVELDIEALIKLKNEAAAERFNLAAEHYKTTQTLVYSFGGFVLFLLFWVGYAISRSITKPVEKTRDTLTQMIAGNYTTQIDFAGEGELGKLMESLKIMRTSLDVNQNTIKETAERVLGQSLQYEGQLAAISKSTGVIEFDLDGKVLAANDIFLSVLGYTREEAIGQSHSAFVEPAFVTSGQYKTFWAALANGEAQTGQFRRFAKGGSEVWLQASYNPIFDVNGKPFKVVKYATDITEQKQQAADNAGQLSAINKIQGVIQFDLVGNIIAVNENFAAVAGYSEKEIVGNHHSMFVDPAYRSSAEYKAFWAALASGEAQSGEYKRFAKGGREVWLQASYNPIFDVNGKAFKVVKYATDITEQKQQAADNAGQLSAINKIQGVIQFDLVGNIIAVNENFAAVAGYSEKEIVGNHHSMFVDPAYRSSAEYKAFWAALASGEAQSGEYKRFAKGGREVWLQASYNPIFDVNGKAFKVVKYATDITDQKQQAMTLSAAVNETQTVIEAAKSGDLVGRVPLEGKSGPIASLCDGVNALMDKMTEVIVQVREAGDTINTAAGEISSGNNDLSSRTEQQASSLEETAASMEELASTVKNNAENAKQANQLAAAASGVAVKGGEVVGQVVSTMSAINQSAKKIEDIISVIDGIAFQTNILALNAAVEAARAGEQGRGFAVVAGEVRNLAQRSASAAKEIKELITDSVSKTAEGTTQVEEAGKTMQEIVSSVQRVTDIMGEITAASVEQSAGIDQVNTAVTSMDEVTQQNAALVEEAAAAAESLVEQAEGLIEVVSVFKLAGGSSVVHQPSLRTIVKRPVERVTSSKPVAKLSSKATAKKDEGNEEWEEF